MYNPIYEFEFPGKMSNLTSNKKYIFRVTSVSGHIMTKSFPETMKMWKHDQIEELFKIRLLNEPTKGSLKVIENLEKCSQDIDSIILWTDCDREGEAIGFNVLE